MMEATSSGKTFTGVRGRSRWLMFLAVVSFLPLASGRRVKVRGEAQGRKLDVREIALEGDLFDQRTETHSVPDQVFFPLPEDQDQDAIQQRWQASPRAKKSSPTSELTTSEWAWRLKKSAKSPTVSPAPTECVAKSTKKSGKSGTAKSKKGSPAPTTPTTSPSFSPTGPTTSPSPTTNPTISPAPSSGKGKGKGGSTKAPSVGKGKGKGGSAKAPSSGKGKGSKGSVRCPEPTVSPAPTITPNPTITASPSVSELPTVTMSPSGNEGTGKSSKSKGSNDITYPGDEVCDDIETGTAPAVLGEEVEFVALLDIEYQAGTGSDEATQSDVIGYLGDINIPVALWIAGCEERAMTYLDTTTRRRLSRFLQDGTVQFAELDTWQVDSVCRAKFDEGTCETFYTYISIYLDGVISDSVLESRIQEAFELFQANINGAQGVLEFDPDNIDIQDADDFDKVVGPPPAVDDNVSVATVIGAAAGGLAFILLIVLLARRNQSDEVSHLKLEEEEGDETFIREFESTASGPSVDDEYETRNVHVVGEADSIFSGWTGYTPEDKAGAGVGLNAHERGDVHKCSSATCEVCEKRRQQGIQFIPTGTPPRPHMPVDAAREYLAEDTVEL